MNHTDHQVIGQSSVEALYAASHWLHSHQRWADAATVLRVMVQLAPTDERGWLLLGDCHQNAGHSQVALELWGMGSVAAEPAPRCHLARFRALRALGRDDDADGAFDDALSAIEQTGDDTLFEVAQSEKGSWS